MTREEHRAAIDGIIKMAQANDLAGIIDSCSVLSLDYAEVTTQLTTATKQTESYKKDNDELMKVNQKLFLQVGTDKPITEQSLGNPPAIGEPTKPEDVVPVDMSTIVDKDGNLI